MAQLPGRTKLFFGMGGLAMALPDLVFMQWIFQRYVPNKENALVPAAWFGFFVLSARVIGALAEPAIGHFSDSCRSPLGRRIPFVRYGLIPFAMAFFLLWTPPVAGQHWMNAVYVLVLMHTYLLLYPTVLTPYLALLPELTPDPKERVTLTTFQAVFIMAATFTFAGMGSVLNAGGWLFFAALVSSIMVLSMVPLALTIRETPATVPREHEPLLRSIWIILGNRAYRRVIISTSFFFFGLSSTLVALPFWVKDYLGRDENTVTILMIPFLITTTLLFGAVGPVVARFGKYRVLLAAFLGTALCLAGVVAVGYLPIGSPLIQLCLMITLMGAPMTGFSVLPFALLSDVIDYDEKRTGRRREALFFAVQGTIQKSCMGLSGLVFGLVAYMGPGDDVSVLGLRCVAALAALASLIGFFIFLGYPIRERNGEVVFPDIPA